jgi:hypothetical protein
MDTGSSMSMEEMNKNYQEIVSHSQKMLEQMNKVENYSEDDTQNKIKSNIRSLLSGITTKDISPDYMNTMKETISITLQQLKLEPEKEQQLKDLMQKVNSLEKKIKQ